MRLEYLPGEAYSCALCGRCCRTDWLIDLTVEEAESLRKLYPETESSVEREGLPPIVMARREDGSCVFLGKGNICRVHAEHGEKAKPFVCRSYPFFFRFRGSSAYLHLSRTCPEVMAGRGKLVGSDEERILAIPAERRRGREVEGDPNLSGRMRISFDDYLRLEAGLIDLILDERWPLDEVLVAGGLYIERAAGRGVYEADEDEKIDLVMSAIAGRRPIKGLYRYIIATAMTALEGRVTGRLDIKGQIHSARILFTFLLGRGRWRFRRLDGKIADLAAVPYVSYPRKERPSLVPTRRLLASHIKHKTLLSAPDIETGYRLIVGAYGVMKYLARARAVAMGRDVVTADDLAEAVAVVEYHFLLHRPAASGVFEKRLVRGYLRRFLFHERYLESMVSF